MGLCINSGRLREDIEALAQFGRDPKGGISRPSFSKSDLEARGWLREKIKVAGLALRQDGAGNIFGRIDGPGKTVMAGSHIDTVLNGGRFDGSIGVLAALECLRRIREEKIALARPLEMAAFTDEEGNLVGDFLGSRAFLGLLNKEEILHGRTAFGPKLEEILKGTEFSIESVLEASKQRPEIEAYLELHIEQGAVLETEEIPIGIVEAIAGKHYRSCSFLGKASHAGTTPLELRRDAFLGLADFALRSTRHVAAEHYGSVVTIGKANLVPGAFSVVPARADFSFEFRSESKETLGQLENDLFALAEEVASTRGLGFISRLIDRTDPVRIPGRIKDVLKKGCEELGYPWMPITSGAGHDAQILACACDSGMIFIPCEDGLSHAPEENINEEDLEKGANLLLHALLKLAT